MKAVVTGLIATYPVGGVVWDYGQYALGLERLGFEVLYLEDTGSDTYDPARRAYGADCAYGVAYLERALGALSPTLAGRWHFRGADGRSFGLSEEAAADAVAGADLFLNVSGGTLLRDAYLGARRKVLIDTDPGWNQFVNYPRWDRSPGWLGSHGWRAHDHFFTYAERIGRPGCLIPALGVEWRTTRPPVVLEAWPVAPGGERWTTVMTWDNFREPVRHEGVTYGTKEMEFGRIERLPVLTRASLEVAVGGTAPPVERWRALGWSVIDSHTVSHTPEDYRDYVRGSRGELSVAKNLYVATRSGWFSCRSTCYLAAGLPVVVQDTGFREGIETGHGLLTFRDIAEARRAIETVESDYPAHRAAAREIARTAFASERVLGEMLAAIGLG